MKDEALSKAISVAGGVQALADAIGITSEAVYQWKRCPPRRVLAVEAATGGKVKRWALRPDLHPPPQKRDRKTSTALKSKSAQPLERMGAS